MSLTQCLANLALRLELGTLSGQSGSLSPVCKEFGSLYFKVLLIGFLNYTCA